MDADCFATAEHPCGCDASLALHTFFPFILADLEQDALARGFLCAVLFSSSPNNRSEEGFLLGS